MEPATTYAIVQGVSTGLSVLGGLGASKKARKAAKKSAKATYATRMEQIRRRELDIDYTKSLTKSASVASNLQQSGSTQNYQNFQSTEFAKEISWMNKAAKMEYSAIKAGGGSSGGANMASAASLLSGVASGVAGYYNLRD